MGGKCDPDVTSCLITIAMVKGINSVWLCLAIFYPVYNAHTIDPSLP